MHRQARLLLLVGSLLAIAGPTPAGAIDSLSGPYGEIRWTAAFYETGAGAIDRVQLDWLSGTAFADPYFLSFDIHHLAGQVVDPGGWAIEQGGPHSAAAASPEATEWLAFEMVFAQPQSDPLAFLFRAFAGGALRDQARVDWDGSAWRFSAVGACCVAGACSLLTEEECASLAGSFQGLATGCDTNPCWAPTPAERTSWGSLKALYR
jgi:hypothetical protein